MLFQKKNTLNKKQKKALTYFVQNLETCEEDFHASILIPLRKSISYLQKNITNSKSCFGKFVPSYASLHSGKEQSRLDYTSLEICIGATRMDRNWLLPFWLNFVLRVQRVDITRIQILEVIQYPYSSF